MEISIRFTHEPIVIPPAGLPSREIGACLEFQGIVREMEGGLALAGLRYEAHEPMAVLHLERIFNQLGAVHPCAAVTFIHRLGWAPTGEASLFIRVLAAHRGPALRFIAEAIDRMKADVPIWKTGIGTVAMDEPRSESARV
jgi:molybdopterin synthase catalytic subunit